MRIVPAILSLVVLAAFSTAAKADHFDDVEDAAEDYRKAVAKVHKELEREKYAPPYLAQISHRLERAADHLEELADDERDSHRIDGAFHEVAALHMRFTDLAGHSPAFAGRHAARRLEEIHRRFDELSRKMAYLGVPEDRRRGGNHHRDHFYYHPLPTDPIDHRRYESRQFDLRLEIEPRKSGKWHSHRYHGGDLERDLRHGRWDRILPHLIP